MGLETAAIIAGVGGLGASLYGANKQAQSQRDANAANRAAVEKADNSGWNSYLLQRGVNAPGTPTGTIPTNGTPVNTRLPLWATINQTTFPNGQTKLAAGPQGGAGGRRAVGYANGQVIYA